MKKILSTENTTRLFFIMMFSVLITPIMSCLLLVCLLQTGSMLIYKKRVEGLTIISQHGMSYLIQIIEYIAFLSSFAPFPFSSWKNHYDK